MPRELTMSDRRAIFSDLRAENPDGDLVAFAREAGIPEPSKFVDGVLMVEARRRDRKEGKLAPAAKKPALSDSDRALSALRAVVSSGKNPSHVVAAAKALLESNPSRESTQGSSTLVVFRGREGASNTQSIAADVTPEELAAAIEHIRMKRATSTEAQLETQAIEQGIDAEELGLAWELYSHAEARAAALRVFLLSQAPEADEIEEASIDEVAV